MRTENPPGTPVRKVMLADYNRQYNYLAKVAENCEIPTAVLYRNNDSALPLIDLLEQRGIPYFCRQRESSFFSSPLVRDILDMLEFAFDAREPSNYLPHTYERNCVCYVGTHDNETVMQWRSPFPSSIPPLFPPLLP